MAAVFNHLFHDPPSFLFLIPLKMSILFFPLSSVEYLDQFEASPAPNESKVWPQRLFKEPVRIIEKYPAGQEGDDKEIYGVHQLAFVRGAIRCRN